MATVTLNSLSGIGDKLITEVTLTAGANPVNYTPGKKQVLRLRNATAGALTPVITGSLAVAATDAGAQAVISYNLGWTCQAIPAGAVREISLDSISKYLTGVVNITSGTGLIATLVEPA
jgi:hypothetical protein